jgi:hypothetical protein
MKDSSDRQHVLRAIRKCLVDGEEYFKKAMDTLDEIGRGSIGVGMTPLVGGYAIRDPKSNFRGALIDIDSAERALEPLISRYRDGRVNESYFKSSKAMILLGDLAGVDYSIIIRKLADQSGKESTWFRLKELTAKIEELLDIIVDS